MPRLMKRGREEGLLLFLYWERFILLGSEDVLMVGEEERVECFSEGEREGEGEGASFERSSGGKGCLIFSTPLLRENKRKIQSRSGYSMQYIYHSHGH